MKYLVWFSVFFCSIGVGVRAFAGFGFDAEEADGSTVQFDHPGSMMDPSTFTMDITISRSGGGSDLFQIATAIEDPYTNTDGGVIVYELQDTDLGLGEYMIADYRFSRILNGNIFNIRDLNTSLDDDTNLWLGFYLGGNPVDITAATFDATDGLGTGAHDFVGNQDPFGTPGTENNWYYATGAAAPDQTVISLQGKAANINVDQVVFYLQDPTNAISAFGAGAADHTSSAVFRHTLNADTKGGTASGTYFTPTPIPEASSILLAIIGFFGFAIMRRQR